MSRLSSSATRLDTVSRADERGSTHPGSDSIEHDIAAAAASEAPPAEQCLKIARSYKQAGDAAAVYRWAIAATETATNFTTWHAAAALVQGAVEADAGPAPVRRARVALLGSYTTSQFVGLLRLAARRLGIALELYEAPYGQYRQETLDLASSTYAFAPEFVVLCVHHGELALPEFSAAPYSDIETELRRWTSLWDAVTKRGCATVIQHNFALPAEASLGNLGAMLPGSRYMMSHALNARLGAAAGSASGGAVSIVDCERLSALVGKEKWFDPRYWHLSKQGVALDALPLLARQTAAVIAARLGLSRKCLVLDLDNTLWGGSIGEDGFEGIQLGDGAEGEAFVAFQEYLLQLKRKGVILAVVSKNDDADAREPFERHPAMRIRLDDIASFVANWEHKSDNIRRVARELNIGLDAIAFVDDNPAERQIIRQLLPEVDVIRLPLDPSLYTRVLAGYLGFETGAFTTEDGNRTAQYRARADGVAVASSGESIEDFYRGLQMQAIVAPFDELQLPRIAQLVGKTNQFNVAARRHGAGALRAFMHDPRVIHLSLRLRDRFADHGLVGVIVGVGDEAGSILDLDTWVMSCRVLGRTADAEMFAHLSHRAAERGYEVITGTYVPTAKNAIVKELFARFGFENISTDANGTARWRYDLRDNGPTENQFIQAVEAWGEGE